MRIVAVLTLVFAVGASACKTLEGPTLQDDPVQAADTIDPVYESAVLALVDTIVAGIHAAKICEIAAGFAVTDATHQCGVEILKHACGLAIDQTSGIFKVTLSEREISEQFTTFTGPVIGRFRGALIDCIKASAINKVKDVAIQTAVSSEVFASAAAEVVQQAGAAAVADAVGQTAVDTTITGVTTTATAPVIDAATGSSVPAATGSVGAAAAKAGKQRVWLRAIGYVACRGAAATIAATIDAAYADGRKKPKYAECTNVRDWLKDSKTWSSCTRTVGSLCALATLKGAIDVTNFLPPIESNTGKVIAQLGSAIGTGLCVLGSEATRLSCSVISSTASQIKMAIQTGNNDWARCLALDRLGACIGHHWGQDGWSNNHPVASTVNNGTTSYKPCCWCYRDYYIDDKWISEDTRVTREHWLGVIQAGDVKTGNCGHMLKRVVDTHELERAKKLYYRYAECRKVYLQGNACAADEDNRFSVWDPTSKTWQQKMYGATHK